MTSNELQQLEFPIEEGKVSARVRGLEDSALPILVLIHGYPQESYMFRYMWPQIPQKLPLFIPDIPGYGSSIWSVSSHSKKTTGNQILAALQTALPAEALTGKQRRKIVLIGHDRGARICHRLAVDNDHPAFEILGTVLMDIVPTIVQFQSFANPQHSVDSFHWPFLAVPSPIPEKMIISTGGAWFVEQMISKWTGINPEGRNRVEEALPLYGSHFEKESVVYASCADYRAGATEDCEEQIKDQEMGRKLAIPTLIIFSKDYLGVRYDMKEVWKQWVSRPDLIRLKGIGNGVGHFLPEEDPRTTTQSVLQWLKEVLDIET